MKNKTYLLRKHEFSGTLFYEFQPGKYDFRTGKQHLDTSVYLYDYLDYSAMRVFAYLLSAFDMCGVTLIDEISGQEFIEKLLRLSVLLAEGKKISEALENMGVLSFVPEWSFVEEKSFAVLDPKVLENTAQELACWIGNALTAHKMVSILGI